MGETLGKVRGFRQSEKVATLMIYFVFALKVGVLAGLSRVHGHLPHPEVRVHV